MKKLFLTGILAFSLPLFAENCPKNPLEWQSKAVMSLFMSDFDETTIASVRGTFRDCHSQFQKDPKVNACLKNLDRFSENLSYSSQPGHSVGLKISDKAYFETLPFPDFLSIPDELRAQDFLQLLDDNTKESLDAALKYIDEKNRTIRPNRLKWTAMIYRSQHVPTPDKSLALGRFFVLVPGEKFDRHIQFGLGSDSNKPLPNNLSVVSVPKNPGRKEAKLMDHWRTRSSSGISIRPRYQVVGKVEVCYECHKTALLPITPDPRYFDKAKFGERLKFINEVMASYQDLHLADVDETGHGPGLGPENLPTRTLEFIEQCSQGWIRDRKSAEKVISAMQCSKCHDGELRGALNFYSARDKQFVYGKSLVEEYIVRHKLMPKGKAGLELSNNERQALFDCLKEEFYGLPLGQSGILRQWLQSNECQP